MPGLPDMYRKCKATEDKDMTPIDFITDHLLNIDGVFDKHDNGDEQKPHNPSSIHFNQAHNLFTVIVTTITIGRKVLSTKLFVIHTCAFYPSEDMDSIFRPPIC